MEIQNIIGLVSGVFAIIGTAGGFVAWLSSKNNAKIADSITKALEPLSYEIRTLNTHLETNNVQHRDFERQLEDHDDRLHDHNTRITVLEKKV